MSDFDTLFSLPAVDDPPATEIGVVMLGFDTERLLAGLGFAALTDDPALVALTVDQLRHSAPHPFSLSGALSAGVARWSAARPSLAAADPGPATVSASLRQSWGQAERMLATALAEADAGPATRAYLVACWIRRHDVDQLTAALTGRAG